MITANEAQVQRSNVVRVFLRYADFRVRVDDNSPVHFDVQVRREDSQGMKWLLMFRIFALDRKQRLMVFEYKWEHNFLQNVQREDVVKELVKKFADPLNAVPGRMEVR